MSAELSRFVKQKDCLICVDSDGCVMDTMEVKHLRCFGPCLVREWGLEAYAEPILARWNEINLYTLTRGVNRFKGLALTLAEINGRYCPVEDLAALTRWVETADELSDSALKKALARQPESASLRKALAWSQAVNRAIAQLPETEKRPFALAREALAYAHTRADVAVVSSANREAVLAEWEHHGLLSHTDIVLAQDAGGKAHCIAQLLKKGYAPERVLMCGDAPGDRQAAEANGVFFYPVLVRRERESWQEFMDTACDRLVSGTYGGDYQKEKITVFLSNLGA